MNKIIKLAKSRRKSKAEDVGAIDKERRKSTFSFISEISSDFNVSKSEFDVSIDSRGGYSVGDLQASTDKSFTKLHKACWLANLDKVKKHSRRNDVNLQDNENRTPLHYAAVVGRADIVDFLFECNANFSLRDSNGCIPYLKAVECNHYKLFKSFLDFGSDVNIADFNGNVAIHYAIKTNNIDTIKCVLQYGGNAERQNKMGRTALHDACSADVDPSIVRLLIIHGAPLDATDEKMRTSLMLACQVGNIDTVKILIDNKADLLKKDAKGLSAEDYALMGNSHEILDLLVSDENKESEKSIESRVVHDIQIDSWNDSEEDISEFDESPSSLKVTNTGNNNPVVDEDAKISTSNDSCSQHIKTSDVIDAVPVDENSPAKIMSPDDKRKMSIVLGLIDEDDSDDEDFSKVSGSSVNFDDSDEASNYVPTLVQHSIASPTKSEPKIKEIKSPVDITPTDKSIQSPILCNSDWDSFEDEEEDVVPVLGSLETPKEGTLGRFGTMAGVDEIWEKDTQLVGPKEEDSEKLTIANQEEGEDFRSQPIKPAVDTKLISQGEDEDCAHLPTAATTSKIDIKPTNHRKDEDCGRIPSPDPCPIEMPSKLTFRRKSLEPDGSTEGAKAKRTSFSSSHGHISQTLDEPDNYGLMRKISLANCKEERSSSANSFLSTDSSERCDGMVTKHPPKKRFSLSATLKSRRKSVVDRDKPADSLELIPENESEGQKGQSQLMAANNRKQFRCFKVSPGESKSNTSIRRSSIAIGESATPNLSSSKVMMKSISRRMSLSSPEPDALKPTVSSSLESDYGNEEPAQKTDPMLVEEITESSVSSACSHLAEERPFFDVDADFFDRTENLSSCSSEDEENESCLRLQNDPTDDRLLRELRIALDKEIAINKAHKATIKQLKNDQTKYLKQIDGHTSNINRLSRQSVELESRLKCLEFELMEESNKTQNAQSMLTKLKDQLSTKQHQFTEEMKLKEEALQKIRFLERKIEDITSEDDQKAFEHCNESAEESKSLQLKLNEFEHQIIEMSNEKTTSNELYAKLNDKYSSLDAEYVKEKSNWMRIEVEWAERRDEMAKDVKNVSEEKKLVEEALDKACIEYNATLAELKDGLDQSAKLLMAKNQEYESAKSEVVLLRTKISELQNEDTIRISLRERSLMEKAELLQDELNGTCLKSKQLEDSLRMMKDSLTERNDKEDDRAKMVDGLHDKINDIKICLEEANREDKSAAKVGVNDEKMLDTLNVIKSEVEAGGGKWEVQINVLESKIESFQSQLLESRNLEKERLDDRNLKTIEELRNQMSGLNMEINDALTENKFLHQNLDDQKSRAESLQATNDNLRLIESKLSARCYESAQSQQPKSENVTEAKVQKLEHLVANLEADLEDARKDKENEQNRLKKLQNEVRSLESSLADKVTENEKLTKEILTKRASVDSEIEKNSTLAARFNECEERSRNDKQKMCNLETNNEVLKDKLWDEKNSARKLKENIVLLKTNLKMARKTIKIKEEESMSNYQTRRADSKMVEEQNYSAAIISRLDAKTEMKDMEIKRLNSQMTDLKDQTYDLKRKLEKIQFELPNLYNRSSVVNQNVSTPEKFLPQDISANSREASNNGQNFEIQNQLLRINSYLEEQTTNQTLVDRLRQKNETKLLEELNTTRNEMGERLSNVKRALDDKIDELSTTRIENRRLKNQTESSYAIWGKDPHVGSRNFASPPGGEELHFLSSPADIFDNRDVSVDASINHLMRRRLETTIGQHINASPEVTKDLPHFRKNKEDSFSHFTLALKKKYLL